MKVSTEPSSERRILGLIHRLIVRVLDVVPLGRAADWAGHRVDDEPVEPVLAELFPSFAEAPLLGYLAVAADFAADHGSTVILRVIGRRVVAGGRNRDEPGGRDVALEERVEGTEVAAPDSSGSLCARDRDVVHGVPVHERPRGVFGLVRHLVKVGFGDAPHVPHASTAVAAICDATPAAWSPAVA